AISGLFLGAGLRALRTHVRPYLMALLLVGAVWFTVQNVQAVLASDYMVGRTHMAFASQTLERDLAREPWRASVTCAPHLNAGEGRTACSDIGHRAVRVVLCRVVARAVRLGGNRFLVQPDAEAGRLRQLDPAVLDRQHRLLRDGPM